MSKHAAPALKQTSAATDGGGDGGAHAEAEADVLPLFPPSAEDLDFDELPCVQLAQTEGSDVRIMRDEELDREVLDIVGDSSSISLRCTGMLPILALHLKHLNKYVRMSVAVLDQSNRRFSIDISNKRSIIRVEESVCYLPLVIAPGWQYVQLELDKIMQQAFGRPFLACVGVKIYGWCRVSKVYLQRASYADAELPYFLRALA